MRYNNSSGDWLFKVAPVFIMVVWALMFCAIIGGAYLLLTQGPEVLSWLGQHGLKGLWCGKDGC